jgi:hypothetical protein
MNYLFFTFILLPVNQAMTLYFLGLSVSLFLFIRANKVSFPFTVVTLVLVILLFVLNSFEMHNLYFLKPLYSIMLIYLVHPMLLNKKRYVLNEDQFLKLNYLILAYAVFLFLPFEINNLMEYSYRGDGIDRFHDGRLTSPFLFAGDFAIYAMFLVFLFMKNRLFSSISFFLSLLATQSKLGLISLLLIYPLVQKRFFIFFAFFIAGVAIVFLSRDYFYYLFIFLDEPLYFIKNNKRFLEYYWLFENFGSVFFSGSNNFVIRGGSTEVESSLVSYIVKSGFVFTAFYYSYLYYVFKKIDLTYVFYIISFLTIFAAPLDRPKLSFVLILMIFIFKNVNAKSQD